jgi:hypothetical protein
LSGRAGRQACQLGHGCAGDCRPRLHLPAEPERPGSGSP